MYQVSSIRLYLITFVYNTNTTANFGPVTVVLFSQESFYLHSLSPFFTFLFLLGGSRKSLFLVCPLLRCASVAHKLIRLLMCFSIFHCVRSIMNISAIHLMLLLYIIYIHIAKAFRLSGVNHLQ